jgi:hypothetical protein
MTIYIVTLTAKRSAPIYVKGIHNCRKRCLYRTDFRHFAQNEKQALLWTNYTDTQ